MCKQVQAEGKNKSMKKVEKFFKKLCFTLLTSIKISDIISSQEQKKRHLQVIRDVKQQDRLKKSVKNSKKFV